VERLVQAADLIIDAVDVTTKPPLRAKFALHRQAKRFGVPVLAGYDVAGLQLLITYEYRRSSTAVLHGRVTGRGDRRSGAVRVPASGDPNSSDPV